MFLHESPSVTAISDVEYVNEDRKEWTCECKNGYGNMFRQNVEGGSCSTEIACGAEQPILESDGTIKQYKLYHEINSDGEVDFKEGPVYANRITSYSKRKAQCIVPTIEKQVQTGKINPRSYTEFLVDTNKADPTCTPQQYSNRCTIFGPGNIITGIRGTNNPGDPELYRVSPPFAPPPPIGMQPCPDQWHGDGSPSNPCVSPDKSVKIDLFTDGNVGREWVSRFTNIDDVRSTKVGGSYGNKTYRDLKWNTVNENIIRDPLCWENVPLKANTYNETTKEYPLSNFCVGKNCTGGYGTKLASWDAGIDGALLDSNGMPSFVSGLPSGGQCTCENIAKNSNNIDVGQRAAYSLPGGVDNEAQWWSCETDSCWSKETPYGKLNTETNTCICTNPESAIQPDGSYKTSMPWTPENQPPHCITDPCNPGGYATQHGDAKTEYTPFDAKGCVNNFVCKHNKCYYRSEITCSNDNRCKEVAAGFEGSALCSTDGKCLFEDLERKREGTRCNCVGLDDTKPCVECEQGHTSDPTYGCNSHCVCKPGYEQRRNDNNPIGYECVDMCNPNPCLNNGECVINEDNVRECKCIPCFEGALCETMTSKGRPGSDCKHDSDCCTGYCSSDDRSVHTGGMVCAQPVGDLQHLPDQLVRCKSTSDCPSSSQSCRNYIFGDFCYGSVSCKSNNDCKDRTGKHDGICESGKCKWYEKGKTPTPAMPPPTTSHGDTEWGPDRYECMEGRWILLEDGKNVMGYYDVLRLPGKDNTGKFRVECSEPGEDCSDFQYSISDATLVLDQPTKNGNGHISYNIHKK